MRGRRPRRVQLLGAAVTAVSLVGLAAAFVLPPDIWPSLAPATQQAAGAAGTVPAASLAAPGGPTTGADALLDTAPTGSVSTAVITLTPATTERATAGTADAASGRMGPP